MEFKAADSGTNGRGYVCVTFFDHRTMCFFFIVFLSVVEGVL